VSGGRKVEFPQDAVPPARGKLLFLVWGAGYAPRQWPRQVSGGKTERPWARISPKRARQVLVSERKLRIATFAVAVDGWREIYPLDPSRASLYRNTGSERQDLSLHL